MAFQVDPIETNMYDTDKVCLVLINCLTRNKKHTMLNLKHLGQ